MGEWYYAKENEKIGPVEKEELLDLIKQKVVKGEDLVWTQGMENWEKSKEVDALKTAIDKPTVSNKKDESTSNADGETFFSVEGRLRRKDYFIRAILLAIPSAFMNVASENSTEPGLLFFAGLVALGCGILIAIQAVKRLHDINMSGWYWLLFLIPLVNFIFGLYIVFKDGTAGPNKYGKDPKGRVAEAS